MINAKQIAKVGRKNIILDISDNLQTNDFYNKSGILKTTVHGRFSKITLNLVDTKSGKGNKAKVTGFNFSINELHTFTKLCGVMNFQNIDNLEKIFTPELFVKNCIEYNKQNRGTDYPFAYMLKINPYKTDQKGLSPVTKIKLSYEKDMRTKYKWKISLESGSAIANEGKTAFLQGAFKQGSYKKDLSSYVNVDQDELIEIITRTIHHITLWEAANYGLMLKYRDAFLRRFKKNNYDESTIEKWNNDPNKKAEKNSSNQGNSNITDNSSKPQVNNPTTAPKKYNCSCCNYEVDQNVKDYSEKHFGKILCIKCQRTQRKAS